MKIKLLLSVVTLVCSMALINQAVADNHSKSVAESASAVDSTKASGKQSFTDSVEYGKYRDTNSSYQVRASELIGEDVENEKNETIGEIDDIIFSESDNKLQVIISVGGFLGIGDKLVSVPYDELRVSAAGDEVYLESTEESLKAKPEFKYNEGEKLGQIISQHREMVMKNRDGETGELIDKDKKAMVEEKAVEKKAE